MKTKTLTLQALKDMKPRTIFEYKAGRDEYRTFMWVAVRGAVHDWSIYTSHNAVPMIDFWAGDKKGIAKYGNKLHDEELVKKLVPCDDEAFTMYRH